MCREKDMKQAARARRVTAAVLVGLACAVGAVSSASAVIIRVSQESAIGVYGSYDLIVESLGGVDLDGDGFIDPFDTPLTIAAFYQYSVPNGASYNGELNGGPIAISSLTQSFFVDAADGLHYVVVHDNPNDGSGGATRMTTVQVGGAAGLANFSVEDDPNEGTTVSNVGADRVFDTVHNCAACCTDGYAIGALTSGELLAQFDVAPTGISFWQATANVAANIALVLDPGRRLPEIFASPVAEEWRRGRTPMRHGRAALRAAQTR